MSKGNSLIVAERRRRIYELALSRGAVSVSDLAESLGVAENTIRADLKALDGIGKLVRSYGGATVKETGLPAPPYPQTREAHLLEKSWIGAAALDYLPDDGSVFINAGTTTLQLAMRFDERHLVEVTTNSPEIAVHLAANSRAEISLIGGRIVRDSLETDGTLSSGPMRDLYWDVAFVGISAIDLDHGITSINLPCAEMERNVMEHARKVIGLCDSSKLGRFARARTGPVTLLDVLITDNSADPETVAAIGELGVQVVLAGPVSSATQEGRGGCDAERRGEIPADRPAVLSRRDGTGASPGGARSAYAYPEEGSPETCRQRQLHGCGRGSQGRVAHPMNDFIADSRYSRLS